MKKMLVLFLMAMSFTFNVQADEHHPDGPCAKDREQFCAKVEQGEGRVMKCLKENEDKLSAECKAHRVTMKDTMKKMAKACHADSEKLCGDKKHDHSEKMKCMKEHHEQLSPSCKEQMKEMKDKHQAMKK
jgi:hypothetical protein